MSVVHGFELVREQRISEVNSHFRLFRHLRTGAQLLSVENDDENKCFGITFCTPPETSNGLPHIMEHSVLCGSRKYPVKEPFIELVKGSLATFINAFTFPDKTIYPLASQNIKDFYNLIDVYLDAVFYPRITPEILMQEGWHYELDNVDNPLIYKGVVFNEMKGAYSSPDNLVYRFSRSLLFPDTTYGVDSGGDPRVIPDLTYEEFKRFHETYYHPSNARIYFYGDDDPEERLRFVNVWLKDFDKLDVKAHIKLQPRFDEPYRHVIQYDAGDDADKKGIVAVSWLLAETHDITLRLGLEILAHILVGTPASPLRKALIDSGLGEDIVAIGLNDGLRQMMFTTGLKGIAVDDAEKIEDLILETLAQLVRDGIDPEQIEASINTVEFEMRESNSGRFPRGLAMMLNVLSTWLYDGDPFAPAAFEAPLRSIKEQAAGDSYFERLIGQYLVNNTHRSTVVFQPDAQARKRLEAEESERLAKARESMTPAELQQVMETTRRLKAIQETPDSPEALASLPSLGLADLDKRNKTIPLEVSDEGGTKVLYHDVFSNGVFYLDVGFNLQTLPQQYLPYVGLFGKVLLEMGTDAEDFVKLSQRIGQKTGGISSTVFLSQVRQQTESTSWLLLRGKAMVTQVDDLLDILRDVVLSVKLDQKERFLQIVLKEKAAQEARLVPAGHTVVGSRLGAHFSLADWANEQIGGVSYLFFLRDLIKRINDDWHQVVADLEMVRGYLVNRRTMLCNITVDGTNWSTFQHKVKGFLGSLPDNDVQWAAWSPEYPSGNEGLTIPAQVNYVGSGGNLYALGYKLHGSSSIVTSYLSTTFLWERVRVQGGAYGGFARFDSNSGVFSYLSYRDPNILNTLDTYDAAGQFLSGLDLPQNEIHKAIIGGIGDMDTYLLPDAKGYASMSRYLTGYTDELRQQVRDEILSTTLKDFRNFGEILAQLKDCAHIVVMGSQEALQDANEQRPNLLPLPITKVM